MTQPQNSWAGNSMVADPAEVRRAFELFADPDNGCEVCSLHPARHTTPAGRDIDALVKAVAGMPICAGVYFRINPVPTGNPKAATDEDVIRRRWIYIDVDPIRAPDFKNDPATDGEKAATTAVCDGVCEYLGAAGFPAPVITDSGNGYGLLYRCDFENDKKTKEALHRLLKLLVNTFNGPTGSVDLKVYNANRLCKIPGTWARKGKESPGRPYRVCRFHYVPDVIGLVSWDALVAAAGPEDQKAEQPRAHPVMPRPASGLGYAEAALESECARVALAVPGGQGGEGRNNALNRSAFVMGQLVGGNAIARDRVESRLYDAACSAGLLDDPGCGDKGIRSTIKSGLTKGMEKPRGVPERKPGPTAVFGSKAQVPKNGRITPPPAWVPFPTDRLPDPLAWYVRENARAIGCDEAAVAVPLLTMMAGLIGNRRKSDVFDQPCCLWAATVGLTGTMKSPAWKAADVIGNHVDRRLEETTKLAMSQYDDTVENWTPDVGPKPEKPKRRRLILGDITTESVATCLQDNENGLIVSMDELSVWFDLFTRYRSNGGSDVTRWLGLWEGGRLKVNRKTSNDLYVENALVSVTGTIQPAILAKTITEGDRESGFLARLLLVCPPVYQKRWTFYTANPNARQKVCELADALNELYPKSVPFAPAAMDHFVARYDDWGLREWLESQEDRRSALAKAPRLAIRLATIHHTIQTALSGSAMSNEAVGVASAGFGCDLADWFLAELSRVYMVMGQSKELSFTGTICEWIRRKGGAVKSSELKQSRNDLFASVAEARDFLDGLVKAEFGRWEQRDECRKPVFVLSPAVQPPDEED